jgi:hypothetical protein
VSTDGSPQLQIARLKEQAVLCEVHRCEAPAEFLVKEPHGAVRPLCRRHLKALGVTDEDIPDQ